MSFADGLALPRPPVSNRAVARSRWSTAAVSCVLGLVVVAVTLGSHALAQDVELQTRVFEIARQLRCPVCISESVADSNAQLAQQMRQMIQQQLEEGRSEAQIFSYFTNRYGDWIMLDPPKRGIHLVVWILPVLAGLVGVAVVTMLVRRWMATARQPIEVDQAALDRVRAELKSGES